MARRINRLNARAVATTTKHGRHADGGCLYLSISPNGGRRWVFLFRWHGKPTEIGFGSARDVSLSRARKLASAARSKLSEGMSLIVLSLSVSPIRNAEGEIVGASEIARDITERKRSEEQIATLAREAEHRVKNCWQRSRPPLIFLSLKHSTASNALLKDAFRPSRMSTRCS